MAMIKKLASMCKPESLAAHLTLAFGLTVLAAMLGIVLYVNHQAIGIVQDASRTLFDHIATETRNQIDNNVSKVDGLLGRYATNPQANDYASASQHAFIRRMSLSLQASPMVSALYVGYEDGSFVLLRRLTSPVAREQLKAPDAASYYLETVRAGAAGAPAAKMALTFLDDALQPVGTALAPADQSYDPRTRNWYREGIASEKSVITNPYWFFLTQERGITMARRLSSGHGVVGVDLGLADLSHALRQMKSTKSSILMIVNAENEVVASSVPIGPDAPGGQVAASPWPASSVATHLLRVVSDSDAGQVLTRTVSSGDVTWVMRTVPLHSGPWTFRMAVATPDNEMLAGARKLTSTLLWLGLAMALAAMAVVQVVARAVSRPLTQLAKDAERIQRFQFEPGLAQVDSSVREIRTLSQSMRQAGITIQRFTEIGQALWAERDPTRLMVRLLREAVNIAQAEGGLLLMSEDEDGKLSVIDRGASAEDAEPRSVDRRDVDPQVLAAMQGKAVAHFDHAGTPLPPFLAGLVEAKPLASGQVFRFSVVPLLNRAGDAVGGLLLAARGQAGRTTADASLDLIQVLSATAAMTIEMTRLLTARKTLLDAVVRMIANSIDAKSPYTGGHCQRVPMLAMSLVRAATRSRSGPFADFALTPDDWEAVKVASWLHDCGKLTTPEYIVDKATKLESLYDRLHEIRMRFELLKSDAWVAYWRGVAEGAQPQALAAVRDAELAALDADFAFVAGCNEGGEEMASQDIERLHAIGERTWMRTLDDRIGISREEKRRKNRTPAPTLPTEEKLLDDRPDHLIEHYASYLNTQESLAGFNMKPLQYRMNLGERYNLGIRRGTLTAEERYQINKHINHTILMLRDLPLTGALRQVPEFAGGHHEKMDGTGYPKGLQRDGMSVVARAMAIADVFEALTAGDRPYKKAKRLSEAVRIMESMKRNRHLDPDLLDLFLTEGIWRDYARQFMEPEQIDEPDIGAVLQTRPA